MSLMTYESTRPWAAAIREAVRTKKMPPWGADASHGHFKNDPTLTPAELETLTAWVDAKAPAGNPKDAPRPLEFVEGWNIGNPDMVLQLPAPYAVPATGTIEYTRFIIPLNFKEDRWVSAAEIRPGNRAVVHHVIAFIREPGGKWLQDAPILQPVPKRIPGQKENDDGQRLFLAGFAPGVPQKAAGPGRAQLVKAGSDLVFEMHYTPNGKPAEDQTKLGIIFATAAPKERIGIFPIINLKFVIPPGADNHLVEAKYEVSNEMTLYALTPHMHLRGKDFEYVAKYPSGETEILLKVPKYDFNWQISYELAEPKLLPPGTVIECTAHFDNSPNNRFNPDPGKEVRWGDQSWDEMMAGFLQVVYDPKKDPSEVFQKPKPKTETVSKATE